jgi:nucleoside-diphosphate-sugar epimerase
MRKENKIIITGAAGLVGQNLILLLREEGYHNIVAIDKHEHNLKILQSFNPDIEIIQADLSEEGAWQEKFSEGATVIILHAQITGLKEDIFIRNNVVATEKVLAAIKKHNIAYTIQISSSVVNSLATDFYTETKKKQEKMVFDSGIACCVLRPTLMFGWFDPKHLGWLARFMKKCIIFPIPGNGKYLRQPLYSRDFCRIIIAAMQQQPKGAVFDIVGKEKIDYIDIIKLIKKNKNLATVILPVPYVVFKGLLKTYALFSRKPPFTTQQLEALTAGDVFIGVDTEKSFNIIPTPLIEALNETFNHPIYSKVYLPR